MHRSPPASEVMGAPEPVRFEEPTDWNEVPVYFIVLAIGLALTGLLVLGPIERGLPPSVPFLVLAIPLGWFGWRVIRYLRERRAFRFEADALEVPKLGLFGRPRRIAYGDVERIEDHKGMRLEMANGSSTRISLQSPDASRIVSAMQLRVGCALERRGRLAYAIELYKSASHEHAPPLDARIALALWCSGHGEPDEDQNEVPDAGDAEAARVAREIQVDRQGDILTHLCVAESTHREAFGAEHPTTLFLQRAIDRFRAQYPDAKADEDDVAETAPREDGRLQDRWLPADEPTRHEARG